MIMNWLKLRIKKIKTMHQRHGPRAAERRRLHEERVAAPVEGGARLCADFVGSVKFSEILSKFAFFQNLLQFCIFSTKFRKIS